MKTRYLTMTLAIASALAITACNDDANKPASTTSPAATQAAPSDVPASVPTSGIVVETVDGDGYTYAQINAMGAKVWVAGPPIALNVGETVSMRFPTQKTNYKSAKLGRTFDNIYFVTELKPASAGSTGLTGMPSNPHAGVPGAPDLSGGMPGGAPGSNPHAGVPGAPGMPQQSAPTKVDLTGIAKLGGGYTVAELYGQKSKLTGKDVTLRGKVVKVTAGVMGTNWIHVRDGSGADGSNDLTVTTNGMANVGDTVVVKGKLSTDVDIGSGYFFPVIVRDGAVSAEKK